MVEDDDAVEQVEQLLQDLYTLIKVFAVVQSCASAAYMAPTPRIA